MDSNKIIITIIIIIIIMIIIIIIIIMIIIIIVSSSSSCYYYCYHYLYINSLNNCPPFHEICDQAWLHIYIYICIGTIHLLHSLSARLNHRHCPSAAWCFQIYI